MSEIEATMNKLVWLILFSGLTTLFITKEAKTLGEAKPENACDDNAQVVNVYKNLNKDCYSLKDKKLNRVVAHADTVVLKNASFHVSEAGRKRVNKEKQKNVHAWVSGEKQCKKTMDTKGWKKVTYNPYKHKSFVNKSSKKPILQADYVVLKPDGVYAK